MIRHRSAIAEKAPLLVIFSARTEADIIFVTELESLAANDTSFHLIIALTRSDEATSSNLPIRRFCRIDRAMIESALSNLAVLPSRTYICGGSSFVEAIANHLLDLGTPNNSIRTERFGP